MAAERRELEGLLGHVDELEKPEWSVDFARLGRLNGVPVTIVANGPGPRLASKAVGMVRERQAVDQLVSIGFCGGLRPSLRACDIFVASEVIGVAPTRMPISKKNFQAGKLLSVDRVVSTAGEKAALREAGADAVEMEAAAVAFLATRYNVPFYAVRVVTDTSDQDFPLDFNQMRSGEGHFSRAKILAAAFQSPVRVFPELIRLNQTTKRAARALGDFLADARF